MRRNNRVLRIPDPELLAEVISEELYDKIVEAGVILVIDADGTFIDSVPMYCHWLSRKLKREIKPSDVTRYDFKNINSDALGMLQESVFPNARMHKNLPLIEGAEEASTEINEHCVAIIILTARPPKWPLIRVTVANFASHKIPFDLLIFSRRKREIVKALKRLGCHVVVVDDDPNVIAGIARLKGVTAIIFTAYYNLYLNRKGVIRAGTTPDDPEKWSVVVGEVLKRRKN